MIPLHMIKYWRKKKFQKSDSARWQGKLSSRCRRKPAICEQWSKKRREERGKKEEREKRKKGERTWGRKEKIAASGFPRCSWNNFDVCMDEGGTTVAFNPFLSWAFFPPPRILFRGVNLVHHMANSDCHPLTRARARERERGWMRKLSLNNESVWRLRARCLVDFPVANPLRLILYEMFLASCSVVTWILVNLFLSRKGDSNEHLAWNMSRRDNTRIYIYGKCFNRD